MILYDLSASYLMNGEGVKTSVTINADSNNYAGNAQSAVVQDKLHLFGGDQTGRRVSLSKKQFSIFQIARLDSCSIVELGVRLNSDHKSRHAALSISSGSEGCLDSKIKSSLQFQPSSASTEKVDRERV